MKRVFLILSIITLIMGCSGLKSDLKPDDLTEIYASLQGDNINRPPDVVLYQIPIGKIIDKIERKTNE